MGIRRRVLGGAALAAVAGMSGCAGLMTSAHKITISSKPAGASVYASGREVGKTPLTIVPDEVFPPRFVGTTYRAAGTLKVAKPGCTPYRREVNDAVLAKDIHVTLQCDPDYRPPRSRSEDKGGAAPAADQSADSRLRRLERLHRDGLITDQEYQRLRKRVLDTL